MADGVLIVSADCVTRTGLRVLFREDGHVKRVREASGLEDAIAITSRERPAVAVVDAESGPLDGIAALTNAAPSLKVVVFTRHDSEALLQQALKAGAHGFVVCTGEYRKTLFGVVEHVRRGEPALCPLSLKHLITAYTEQTHEAPSMFTPRETEVLTLMVEGDTNESMATQLHLSVGTIKSHVAGILRKVGVPSRAAAIARIARVSGLNRTNLRLAGL